MTGVERIGQAFIDCDKKAALIPYLMAGYPDLESSCQIAESYVSAGADIVEVGLPFSDPLADGPVIQAAASESLAQGTTFDDTLKVAATIAERVPVVVMCYINSLLARGIERAVEDMQAAGVAGLIVPDLPVGEDDQVAAACESSGTAHICLVAPTTSAERLPKILERSTGFVYAVAVTGTTGERTKNSNNAAALLERIRSKTQTPVALGFGISEPEQAATAAAVGAQGVIVGSRLVRAVSEEKSPADATKTTVEAFARALR